MVFKSCGSMLPIVAVVVWGSIVQERIFSRNFAPERQNNGSRIHIVPRRTKA